MSDFASREQRDSILLTAGRLLLKHRRIDLHRLDRRDANRILLSMMYELEHGVVLETAPPPDTRLRKRKRASDADI